MKERNNNVLFVCFWLVCLLVCCLLFGLVSSGVITARSSTNLSKTPETTFAFNQLSGRGHLANKAIGTKASIHWSNSCL